MRPISVVVRGVGLDDVIQLSKAETEELIQALALQAADPDHAELLEDLRSRLDAILKEQADPRVTGYGDIFESYPYFGRMQPDIGGFKEPGRYNPAFLPPGHPACGKTGAAQPTAFVCTAGTCSLGIESAERLRDHLSTL